MDLQDTVVAAKAVYNSWFTPEFVLGNLHTFVSLHMPVTSSAMLMSCHREPIKLETVESQPGHGLRRPRRPSGRPTTRPMTSSKAS